MKLSNMMVSYCVFAFLISLCVGIYGAGVDAYGITPQDTIDGQDVGTRLNNLNLISGMSDSAQGLHTLTNPASFLDIVGGLVSIGIGIIKTLTGIMTTPLELLDVVMEFYYIPSIVYALVGAIMIIRVGFIILKAYTGSEF